MYVVYNLTLSSPFYSVGHSVDLRVASLLLLLVYYHLESALSGKMRGWISGLKPEQHSLHL